MQNEGSPQTGTAGRIIACVGGLTGAAGVGLSAYAAHAGGTNGATAATFLLAHAPVLVAIGLAGRTRPMFIAALVLAAGLALFCGDLLMREFIGARLFAMAVPAGGLMMIGGWLAVAAAALVRPRT